MFSPSERPRSQTEFSCQKWAFQQQKGDLFWDTCTKIFSNALMRAHLFSCNQKRCVAAPQTVIQTNATNSRPFLTAANTVYSQVVILYSQAPRRHVVISLKSMQSSRLYFIIGSSLLITTSVLINFYKGFSSRLRHLYGGRKLPGDLEKVTWSCSKNVKIRIIIKNLSFLLLITVVCYKG